MAEAGYIVLVIVLLAAIISALASILCVRTGPGRIADGARIGIFTVFGLYTLSLAIILYAFVSKDFSIQVVAEHSSRSLPWYYTLSALYADKTGSLFFWGWLISLFAAVLALRRNNYPHSVKYYSLFILAILEVFFTAFITLGINVFEKNPFPPAEGYGLNPLLQNVGMLIHPPLLYLGFTGFAVVFALVMASVISKNLDFAWSGTVRRWTIFAWCALGAGNLLGMWWSYNELGWGGYWAWDVVENAGLMPWLLGTAFLHTISVRRRRNYLHLWSLVLIIFTFALTLLSPFITHGGIESPLHGFYGSPFPPFILAVILITIIVSITLVLLRGRSKEGEAKPESLISREGAFLLTSIILVLLVLVILTGTVLPRIVEIFGGTKIVLDRSFFDRTCGPILIVLVLLMGICPLLGWGKTAWQSVKRNLPYTFTASVIIAVIMLITGVGNWYAAVSIICGLPLFTIFLEWGRGARALSKSRGVNVFRSYFSLLANNRPRYGGFLAHIGVILIALGIIASSFYQLETTRTLDIGEVLDIGDYRLTYTERMLKQDSMKLSAVASVSVDRNGHRVGVMYPSLDYWFERQDSFAEVAVRTTAVEDLFISLVWTDYTPADKSATFRVLVNPLIVWIWTGGGFFLLGGILSFSASEKKQPGAGV